MLREVMSKCRDVVCENMMLMDQSMHAHINVPVNANSEYYANVP